MQALMHEPDRANARETAAARSHGAFSTLDIHDADGGRFTIFWQPGEAQIIADAINAVLGARAPLGGMTMPEVRA